MKRPRNLIKRGATYYYRRQSNKRDVWTSLRTGNYREACQLMETIRERETLAKLGFGDRPRVSTQLPDVASVLAFYDKAECPKRNGKKREGTPLKLERNAIANLSRLLGNKDPHSLTPADWQRYVDRRLSEYPDGKGGRTIDLEWETLSSAFRHAIRYQDETGITAKPLKERPRRVRLSEDVTHCREFQPENADELHSLARYFLEQSDAPRKGAAVFGWLTLLSAMIGQRSSEMLQLRSDAKSPRDPGYNDGEHLWLYRSKTHKGTAPFIKIGQELRECLAAHSAWKADNSPLNPWFFPSPRSSDKPVEKSSFQHALARASAKLGMSKRSAHGLRSYYVNVLRSQGVADSEIALRIGHKSGGKLIVQTYGEILPIKLGWLPSNADPAWVTSDTQAPIAQPLFG